MFWMCANIKCKESSGLGANLQTWIKMQEVQNKLDLALQELKTLSQIASTLDQSESIDEVIKEITGELHD